MLRARQTERLPLVVLALGIATLLSAVATTASLADYEGVGLIGYRTAAAAAASVLCAVLTVVGFIVTSTGDRFSLRATIGFACMLGAAPAAMEADFIVVLIRMALGLE